MDARSQMPCCAEPQADELPNAIKVLGSSWPDPHCCTPAALNSQETGTSVIKRYSSTLHFQTLHSARRPQIETMSAVQFHYGAVTPAMSQSGWSCLCAPGPGWGLSSWALFWAVGSSCPQNLTVIPQILFHVTPPTSRYSPSEEPWGWTSQEQPLLRKNPTVPQA